MSDPSLSPEIYRAALPSVRDRPLPDMPGTLYGYVWKVSTRQQVRLCLLSLLVFPLTLAPLELQRRIVDGAIEGGDLQLLLLLGGVYLAAILCLAALKYVRNTYANRVGEGVVRDLCIDVRMNVDPGRGDDLPCGIDFGRPRGSNIRADLDDLAVLDRDCIDI